MIVIMDFEASSLATDGYPIQVAWNEGDEVRMHYINPARVPGWVDWDEQAEALHGLSREFLARHGKHPLEVAAVMNRALAGATVYSDAPAHERAWCARLFDAAGLECRFRFADFREALAAHAPPGVRDVAAAARWLDDLHRQARSRLPGLRPHRADEDVRLLVEMYRLARGDAAGLTMREGKGHLGENPQGGRG